MCRRGFVLFILFFVVADAAKVYAEDTLASKAPAVVLVQLCSEHNRIAALTSARKPGAVAEVKQDAAGAAAAMIHDFKDHFSFCPVYYFIDTNEELIKKRDFDGVLMNADGSPAKNIVIDHTHRKYYIVYYGYPVSQPAGTKVVKDPNKYEYDSGEPMGRGLIVNDSSFRQVTFFYKFGYNDRSFKKENARKYYYQSKKFDIEYFPFAKKFDKELKEHNKEMRIPG